MVALIEDEAGADEAPAQPGTPSEVGDLPLRWTGVAV
jgi:hypothetical protein